MPKEEEDPDIVIIKARKMKVLREQAAGLEKARIERQRLQESKVQHKRGNREIISDYLYDRGEEVLKLAESQFPIQTKSLVSEIVELIRIGEIKQKICHFANDNDTFALDNPISSAGWSFAKLFLSGEFVERLCEIKADEIESSRGKKIEDKFVSWLNAKLKDSYCKAQVKI